MTKTPCRFVHTTDVTTGPSTERDRGIGIDEGGGP